MNTEDAIVGTRIRSLIDFSGVPAGTEGVIDDDYKTGVMIAWDLPDRPLPPNYKQWNGKPSFCPGQPLRDGFDKKRELRFLEKVNQS